MMFAIGGELIEPAELVCLPHYPSSLPSSLFPCDDMGTYISFLSLTPQPLKH